jgi:hypothetical protein
LIAAHLLIWPKYGDNNSKPWIKAVMYTAAPTQLLISVNMVHANVIEEKALFSSNHAMVLMICMPGKCD